MNNKVKIFVIFLGYLAFAEAQFPTCNPLLVEWFSHPHECESYIICFHGVQHVLPCAPGLHFSPTEKRCTFPDEAQCHVNYMCPPVDDINNPVFLPDSYDCGIYYLCSRGSPIKRECAPGLWWDVVFNWCNTWDDAVCDNRTVINPGNPGNRTTLGPTTTTEMTTTSTTTTTLPTTTTSTTTTTTTTTLPPTTTPPPIPNLAGCHLRQDLFDGTTYIKSMCIVNANINYEAARQRCVSLNMNLFIIDDSRVQTPFFEATTWLLRGSPGGFVWINGRRDNVNGWRVLNADNTFRGPLYSGVSWVNTTTVNGPTNGDCLRYSSQFGPYQAMGIGCTSTSWLVCEHSLQTEQPPTTTPAPTTTTPPSGPNLAVCWRRADLFHNGTYLKSSCIINTSQNYAAAQQGCRTNGMELFAIDSPQVQTQFRNSTTQLLIAQQRGFVWINGRVDDECREWYTFNPTRNLMFSAVHWVQQEDFVGRNTGDCLRYTQQFNPEYFAMGVACNSASWYICEFSVPPVMDEF